MLRPHWKDLHFRGIVRVGNQRAGKHLKSFDDFGRSLVKAFSGRSGTTVAQRDLFKLAQNIRLQQPTILKSL